MVISYWGMFGFGILAGVILGVGGLILIAYLSSRKKKSKDK